ncbi:MAG: hypothetical protein ACI89X_001959, partial [Planctomycetota bacterium]
RRKRRRYVQPISASPQAAPLRAADFCVAASGAAT